MQVHPLVSSQAEDCWDSKDFHIKKNSPKHCVLDHEDKGQRPVLARFCVT